MEQERIIWTAREIYENLMNKDFTLLPYSDERVKKDKNLVGYYDGKKIYQKGKKINDRYKKK